MITDFYCADTKRLFNGERVARFANIAAAALRKLAILNRAETLDELRVPYGNHLEALKDDRKGQHSIRVNSQWRVCFVWIDTGVTRVEIVDYH